MSEQLPTTDYPELVFALAGPVGVDLNEVEAALTRQLQGMGYSVHVVKITDEMNRIGRRTISASGNYLQEIRQKIRRADEICRAFCDNATLARQAVSAIMRYRESSNNGDKALEKIAFVIRQLKRPEEVNLLRRVYGRLFFLISAYGSRLQRTELLDRRIKRNLSALHTDDEISIEARNLVADDERETADPYGQNLGETFPLADVFIDGVDPSLMRVQIERFVHAVFGRNDITPTKYEYGMYAAKSASLRSSDLSRQVGAAIFSPDGEMITQGCNEVPKAMGGTYWDTETPDHRDIRLGDDPNEQVKKRILRDLFKRLLESGILSEKALRIGEAGQIVEHLVAKDAQPDDPNARGALVGAEVLDLTEFGRVVHAEMCAICDAARIGRSVKGATLFCTTFPCHNCAKHILASGIARVVYVEPYPKSRVKDLHRDEIEIEESVPGKVSFVPFLGISPTRYRDLFQKGRRKDRSGQANKWYYEKPMPMVDLIGPFYLLSEKSAVAPLIEPAGTKYEQAPQPDASGVDP